MHDMSMENDNSRSSSEDSPEHSSANETVLKMDLSENLCSKSDEGKSRVGLADKTQRASSSGLSLVDDQLKFLVRHSKGGAVDHVSSENVRHPDQDSHLSTDKPEGTDENAKKFEKNLEKFFKEREPLKEVQLRKKTEISARLIKSDGEICKIIEYCGDVLKLSSILSNSERSSAPPTFNNEMEAKQNTKSEKLSCDESNKKMIISKGVAQSSDVFKNDAVGTETSSPSRALDHRLSKISTFKVPISPNHKTTPDKSAKMVPTISNEDVESPNQRRPTNFNVKPRKTFYTFSPGSSSGVLRQCQSLPDIYRPRRKDEAQRRSINFGEHSRIVRFLFRDKPEPATPESKMSTFYKSTISLEKAESTEKAPEVEVPMTLQIPPSKTCRRLVFGSCSKETGDKNNNMVEKKVRCIEQAPKSACAENASQVEVPKTVQNRPSRTCRKLIFGTSSKETTDKSLQTGVSCDSESQSKRKNASYVNATCSISKEEPKKERTSPGPEVEECENGENVRIKKSPVNVECYISAKKARTSPETKIEEVETAENKKLVDVGCSISTKKVKTSSGTKMEGNGENVRKNESLIDVECCIPAKKVKTSSEKNVDTGCENV